MAISLGAESLISIDRLQEFLILEERQLAEIEEIREHGIQFSDVSASWTENENTLKKISLQIPPGTLCAIVGPVGAGKSSLLQVLLGELPVKSGKVALGGEISYSSQKPWLFQSTIRNNILFGQPYNKFWYEKVIDVCALQKDLEQFPQRDKTVVGERGVSLSGGQRARINLARAIYRQADIYLLDDPLSAVDTHVGRHLFDECIHKHLKGRTRIIVTHQLQYLKKANLIVVINNGQIEAQGTFEELSNSQLDFTKLLIAADESIRNDKTDPDEEIEDLVANATNFRKESILSVTSSIYSNNMDITYTAPTNEEETTSDPNASPFFQYLKATNSLCLVFTLIFFLFLAQAASTVTDYFVAFWTEQENVRYSNNSIIVQTQLASTITKVNHLEDRGMSLYYYNHSKEINLSTERHIFSQDDLFDKVQLNDTIYNLLKTTYAMYLYGALVLAAIILTITRSLLMYKVCMLSSKNLHATMFHVLLTAPMRFFDENPSGRILNRFSKDMGAIDEILPRVLMDATQITMIICGIVVNVGLSNPYITIAMAIVGALFWQIRKWYISSSRILKLIEGATKSPVFTHITSTLNGIPTIRASKAEQVLIDEFDDHQDVHTSAWFMTIASIDFFGLWLDILCLIFIACVTFSFVVMQSYSAVSGSFVGLAVTQSLTLCGMLQFGMRQTAEVVNQLTSVERVLQYTKIKSEKPFETPKDKMPPKTWPSMGKIEFRDLSLKYVNEEPPVLKNLEFTVQPGEKIGIVGRTGAGKSSLISALFRLAPIEGSVLIDDVDTKNLGFIDLRRSISIIPQEPSLFAATMRYNLDPFNEFDDAKLWKALEEVELKDAMDTLDFSVAEGGANFSLGQRQLVCLARATLRKNKILIMDEATANVDPRTDAFIQEAIRKKFKDCTVLTIAHRLNTIMDSDRVLTMSFGSMVEFDHPYKLLQIPDGYFHKMVLETGPVMYAQLSDMALDSYNKKHN
nr:probable multidrug resistance-associated protein lethal(2)03659 [Leptinotarsa decemlineata]